MPESAPSPEPAVQDAPGAFVSYLHRLYERRKRDGTARAALALLRRSAADSADQLNVLRVVGAYVPDDLGDQAFDAYLLVAELFGVYAAGASAMPDPSVLPRYQRSLGASARHVNGRRLNNKGDSVDENEGISRRFQALLALPAEDLPDELRRFLRLLRSKDAPVDFYQLLHDLLAWSYYDRPSQRRWARDYWTPIDTNTDDTSTSTT